MNGVLFDLDGTLLNTLEDLTDGVNAVLTQFDYPLRSLEEVRRFVGNGVRLLMTRAIPGGESFAQFEECYACFRQHYLHHNLDTTAPYPGIMELIAKLNANGKKVATQTGDKVFSFRIPLTGEVKLEAVAGDCRDTARIRHVEKPNPAYKLGKDGGNGGNWT